MSATTPDTPQVLLEHHLKALRLPTMLREYDKLARTCAVEKVDFPNYLLRLAGGSTGARHKRFAIWQAISLLVWG
jgi:hypothetical protein